MPVSALRAVELSNAKAAADALEVETCVSTPWEVHLSLFPTVQRVLNPPFINPHLPKMYRICREFIPYLQDDEVLPLVRLETMEYARRPKLRKIARVKKEVMPISFDHITSTIRRKSWRKAAALMAGFSEQHGVAEFARRMLLLGSGYLNQTLGHSFSCTAFILLEIMDRFDEGIWPAFEVLADYFCKGSFIDTPDLSQRSPLSHEELDHQVLRATSGRGLLNLHHTITLYAIERTRHLFSEQEYNCLIGAWIGFMGEKSAEPVVLTSESKAPFSNYQGYCETFSRLEPEPVVSGFEEMVATREGRITLGNFLIKGVCDRYDGHYDPHYLTGLGSALWLSDRFWHRPVIALNGLYQYVDYFFDSMRASSSY